MPAPTSVPEALRVALVCPYSLSRPGGVQGQVVGLARALEARGHQATVFAPLDDSRDAPVDVDLVVTGHSVSLPSNGSRAPVSISPRAAFQGVSALQLGRYDVAHVHEPFSPGMPLGLLAHRDLPPLVATFHRSGGSFFYSALRPLARTKARRFALRCAVSEAARETATAAVGGHYDVLFNGVEIDRFRDAERWPTEGPTILFLGRHEERKGLRVLLDAWDRLARPAGPGASPRRVPAGAPGTAPLLGPDEPLPALWIAGDGPETDWLRRLQPESAKVHWLGVLTEEEKVRRLAAADILCAPSLGGESFGMVLLEAMAARALVVASDIDGYRDAVGGCAVLVPPGDPEALATALAGALRERRTDAGAHDERLEQASTRADGWSMDLLAERYEERYRAVVARGGREPGRRRLD